MADVTIKAPPDVLDEFAGITGLFPLTPSQPADPRTSSPMSPASNGGGPLTPNWTPAAPATLGTGAPDVGGSPLPPIAPASAPASDMTAPAPPVGSVDYAQQVAQSHADRKPPGVLGKIGGWASSILTPNIAAMIPQTPLGRIVEQNRDLGRLKEAETEQRAEETQRSEEGLRGAQTAEAQAGAGLKTAQGAAAGKGEWKLDPETNTE